MAFSKEWLRKMAEKSSTDVAPKAENVLPSVTKTVPGVARLITQFSKHEIQCLFKAAHTISKTPFVEIRVAPKALNYARVLIVLSRKVGNAPARNLLRRRLKAIFYEEQLFERPWDFIIIGRAPLTHHSFDSLKNIVLSSYNLIHEHSQ